MHPSQPRQRNSALLTVDLTTAVADEAIRRRDSIIIAYRAFPFPAPYIPTQISLCALYARRVQCTRQKANKIDPIIFRPLKSLTLNDTQQTSLLRLAQEGISVYSPHTAVDASPGGMGDWLCDVVTGCYPSSTSEGSETNMSPDQTGYSPVYPNPRQIGRKQAPQIEHTRSTIHPLPVTQEDQGEAGPGMGRLVTLSSAQPLRTILEYIANGTGLSSSSGIPIAIPQSLTSSTTKTDVGNIPIQTISVCPGSGASVLLKTPSGEIADLIFTGEMSHHETLAAVERGSVVVALRHSNTERGFLHAVMREALEGIVQKEWKGRETEGQGQAGEVLKDDEAVVHVSEVDRDPFGVLRR